MIPNDIKELARDLGGDEGVAMVERIDEMKKEFGQKVHDLQIEMVRKYAPTPGREQVEVATAICEAMSVTYASIAAGLGTIMEKPSKEIDALAIKSLQSNLATAWERLAEMPKENDYVSHG